MDVNANVPENARLDEKYNLDMYQSAFIPTGALVWLSGKCNILDVELKSREAVKTNHYSEIVTLKLTRSLIHHFETALNSNKLQTATEMWLLKDFKIQIA